jgi:hypothetical protein
MKRAWLQRARQEGDNLQLLVQGGHLLCVAYRKCTLDAGRLGVVGAAVGENKFGQPEVAAFLSEDATASYAGSRGLWCIGSMDTGWEQRFSSSSLRAGRSKDLGAPFSDLEYAVLESISARVQAFVRPWKGGRLALSEEAIELLGEESSLTVGGFLPGDLEGITNHWTLQAVLMYRRWYWEL